MAQRDQTAPEGTEVAPELAEEKAAAKGGKSFLLILVAVVVAALGAGGALAYVFYPEARAAASTVGLADAPGAEEEKDEPVEYGEFLEFQGLIINPSDSDGRRYLMVNIGLEAANAQVLDVIGSKEMVIRDRMLRILGQRTVSELASVQLRDTLKKELLTAVNDILADEEVARLYFTQYVLQ